MRRTADLARLFLVIVFASILSDGQTAKAEDHVVAIGGSQSADCFQLVGRYVLAIQTAADVPVAAMEIVAQQGTTFDVVGDGWRGRGVLVGQSGYYDWLFDDGRRGRTSVRVDSDGNLLGAVRQSGGTDETIFRGTTSAGGWGGRSRVGDVERDHRAPLTLGPVPARAQLLDVHRSILCRKGSAPSPRSARRAARTAT